MGGVLNRVIRILVAFVICVTPAWVAESATRRSDAGTTTAVRGTSARSAVRSARSATPTKTASAPTAPKPVAARSGTVAARAATTQKVVGTGTTVTGAAKNSVVDDACQQKYEGCMDAFCVMENANGGRCICSNQVKKYDTLLAEISELDQQSYKLATAGVQAIESGVATDDMPSGARADNSALLALWNKPDSSSGKNATGAALFQSSHDTCVAKMPECANEMSMLKMMYAQRIKSDCTAYENSLRQQKNASAQKLAAAEKALRDAALDQYRSANKYDLGQCTIEFKKCMIGAGGCGEDFSKCASVAASDNTNVRKSRDYVPDQKYVIQGTSTAIEIYKSTYDTLMTKKPLCETVTKSCVAVADQVWDTFLRETAPQIRAAELIAEDNARQDCIGAISNCFQQACKDNVDPNDPDGSYDMCLTHPGSMLNLCKVELNACGVDASSEEKANESMIWEYVVARLAAMRVDACTTDVKQCLQSADRCGKDYTQCVGLDTDTIIRMCPYEKLAGCQMVYGEQNIRGDDVYDQLANMVQGVMLNIDNNMLEYCQRAVDAAMIRVCGDTTSCNDMITDENIGARSLRYGICEYSFSDPNGADFTIDYTKCRNDVSLITDTELGRVQDATTRDLGPVLPITGVIDGTIYWENIGLGQDGNMRPVEEYLAQVDSDQMNDGQRARIIDEYTTLQSNIDNVMATIEADPTVQYCMTGRRVQGINDDIDFEKFTARFPKLTQSRRMIIANNAIKIARGNYYKKYDELNQRMVRDYASIASRQAEIRQENAKDVYRDAARISCKNLAPMSAMPKSPVPPPSKVGMIAVGAVMVAAIATACVFTFGAASFAGAAAMAALAESTSFVGGIVAATQAATASLALSSTIATAAIATAATATAGMAVGAAYNAYKPKTVADFTSDDLSGYFEMDQWNYKEEIKTTFDWENISCKKCVRIRRCKSVSQPMFGSPKCKRWDEWTDEGCTDTQF